MEFWVENRTIFHQFYKKPMSSRTLTMARSALPVSQKRSILVQEGLRRLANFSPELPWLLKVQAINLLCIDMHDSGHTERFRSTVVSRVIGKYSKNLENHRNGTKSMLRTREEREEQTYRWQKNEINLVQNIQYNQHHHSPHYARGSPGKANGISRLGLRKEWAETTQVI